MEGQRSSRLISMGIAVVLVAAGCAGGGSGDDALREAEASLDTGHAVRLDGDDPRLDIRLVPVEELPEPGSEAVVAGAVEMVGDAFEVTTDRPFGGALTIVAPAPGSPADGPDPFLAYFDDSRADWTPVPTAYEPAGGTVTAETGHASIWAVMTWAPEAVTRLMTESDGALPSDRPFCRTPSASNFDLLRVDVRSARNRTAVSACLEETGATNEVTLKVHNGHTFAVVIALPPGATHGDPIGGLYPRDVASFVADWIKEFVAPDVAAIPPGATLTASLPLDGAVGELDIAVVIDSTSIAADVMWLGGQLLLETGGTLSRLLAEGFDLMNCLVGIFTTPAEGMTLIRAARTAADCLRQIIEDVTLEMVARLVVLVGEYFDLLINVVQFNYQILWIGSAEVATLDIRWRTPPIAGPFPTSGTVPRTTSSTITIPPTTPPVSEPPPNTPPTADLEVCSPDGCVGATGTLMVTAGTDGGPELVFRVVGARDPDDDPLSYEWLINGQQVSLNREFRFDAAALSVGRNDVSLVVSDGRGGRASVGAVVEVTRLSLPTPLCRETVEPPPGGFEFGDQTISGDLTGDGVADVVAVSFGDSTDNLVWDGRVRLTAADGTLLHEVDGLTVSTLFGVPAPLVMGGVLDATGDGQADVVLCLAGTFSANWDVQVLVLSRHTGSWITALDEFATNGVVEVAAPAVVVTETKTRLLGACFDITERRYVFSGAAFAFDSEEVSYDWKAPECDPETDQAADNPFGMRVGFTEYVAGPGETIEVLGPGQGTDNVILLSDDCEPECDLYIWYLDGTEIGRGDEVLLPIRAIPAGTLELTLVVIEPEADEWRGTVTVVRIVA